MKNLQNKKTKLTIIFTIIISVLFIVIGTSFFTFKFFSDKETINQNYNKIEKNISEKENEIQKFIKNNNNLDINNSGKEEIENILNFAEKLFKNPESEFIENEKTTKVEEILVEGKSDFPFFNEKIAVFDKEEIIYSNIDDNEKIDFKKYEKIEEGLTFEKKLAVIKTNIGNKKSLIFINRKYSNSDLFFDILYLFLGTLFFSILFYFIGNIFVKIVLKPVEENIDEMNSFIDNAGHELKTPLAAINSSAGLLKEMKTFDPELIQEVINETNKSNEIIGALRSLTNISKNADIQKFGINSIIKEVLNSQKEKIKNKKIILNLNIENKDIEINANKNYTYILISNLISNAVKYNKDSGSLGIEIGENFITISDSGIGIPQAETKKIFERFYRTKNHKGVEGYGLGLSMVEKISKMYNWKIEIESIESVGTKIKIKF